MSEIKIWPNLYLVFIVFNLLGWWFKGQIFFSWWWMIPIVILDSTLSWAMVRNMEKMVELTERAKKCKKK